ncbi:hypothetical protein ACRW0L_23900 [Escherichia coli]
MATTVIAAFNEFMKDTVNLKKADTDDARASRDWLIGKMNDFEKDDKFPVSFPAIHIAFGSFARRTKIRPLDDIDLMFGLTGQGATYTILSDRITVTSSGEGSRLHSYRHSGADTVCSVRILNAFKNRLQDIAQYAQADIRRNQEAVTLKLVSKDWNFDIVPCFITSEDAFGRTYYLIDGSTCLQLWNKEGRVVRREGDPLEVAQWLQACHDAGIEVRVQVNESVTP